MTLRLVEEATVTPTTAGDNSSSATAASTVISTGRIPDVEVYDQNGKRLNFYSDLVKGKTVAINFIFTTCTTICPPLTATFRRVQQDLGELSIPAQLISVSVDPGTDDGIARLYNQFDMGADSVNSLAVDTGGFVVRNQNIFDQGEIYHPGLVRLSTEFFKRSGTDIDLTSMISCSKNAGFSNYVVARPSFWRTWLEIAETLFRMAEDPTDPLHSRLNAVANYGDSDAQYKLFILERLAPLVLQRYDLCRIKVYPLQTSFSDEKFSMRFFPELMIMDSMKFCYLECGNKLYLDIYQTLRQRFGSMRE